MANLLWGSVYYQDHYAGVLQEEPGDRTSFTYDKSYLEALLPAIAYSLPLQSASHICERGLHPFFDNLVAEGWLENAQSRLLEKRSASRFELLLAFGYDCAGAVSVLDPEPARISNTLLDLKDKKERALFQNRASLSGIQPKLALVHKDGKFLPAKLKELSTYIAKFPSLGDADLTINEYLSTKAFKALVPDDDVVDLFMNEIEGFDEPVLIIKRFDRSPVGRIHFEEFNQLLERKSVAKYDGSYKEMADFIKNNKECIPTENYRLYRRILAGLLLGNTDMHLKNFAMFHATTGLRLTESYDQVAAFLYNYKTMALPMAGVSNLAIGNVKAKHIIKLGEEFSLPKTAISMAIEDLGKNRNAAKEAIIAETQIGSADLKNQLIHLMDTRWNATFALIGQTLLKKP
jgi:serine/threonine-protein kinase HipA